jgi:CBS domain-containing protein
MDVRTILKQNPRPEHKITGAQSVADAIKLMTAKKTSVLIVTDDDNPTGIFTERDVLRYYQQARKSAPSKIKLNTVITHEFIAAKSTDTIAAAIDMMIKADIYHLPVIENKKIIGVLTLRDLFEFQIESLTAEIHHLKDYIEDMHEAGQD